MEKHFGIICPPSAGHMNPMMAIGRELQRRGHKVSYVETPDGEAKSHQLGIDYFSVGQLEFPLGSLPGFFERTLRMNLASAVGYAVKFTQRRNAMLCREVPGVIKNFKIDVLLVDQLEVAGGSIAEFMGIPFITICNALPVNYEAGVPPYFTNWSYNNSGWSSVVNDLGYTAFFTASRPVNNKMNDFRRQKKLAPFKGPNDAFSKLAQISQLIEELDFPRKDLPSCFHYTGPLRDPSAETVSFPYDQLTDKPIVYASLGTIVNTRRDLFERIARACEGLSVQLVMAHGGALTEQTSQKLPGAPLVFPYVPQLTFLERASLVITHAGLNTVMDAVSHGVPMVCLPITGEQPGIAARVQHTGAGVVVSDPLVANIRSAIQKVLNEHSYTARAKNLQVRLHQAGGTRKAADIIESAVGSTSSTPN
jgi:zeaxanthin glucosyltransferase